MAHDDKVVVDEEVGEELYPVVESEQPGLLSLNVGQRDGHTLETEKIDGALLCD